MKPKDYLASIYYDPKHPASYASPEKLWKAVRAGGKVIISLGKIKKWLRRQDVYTTHRPSRRKFKRNKVIVDGIDEQWDVDLMDMNNVSKLNDGFQFVLIAKDIFSRYAWAIPIRTKQAEHVIIGLRKLLATQRRPQIIRTDKGKEFTNAKVQQVFQENDILHTVTFDKND